MIESYFAQVKNACKSQAFLLMPENFMQTL